MLFRAITQRWFTSLTSKSWLRSYGLASIASSSLKNGFADGVNPSSLMKED